MTNPFTANPYGNLFDQNSSMQTPSLSFKPQGASQTTFPTAAPTTVPGQVYDQYGRMKKDPALGYKGPVFYNKYGEPITSQQGMGQKEFEDFARTSGLTSAPPTTPEYRPGQAPMSAEQLAGARTAIEKILGKGASWLGRTGQSGGVSHPINDTKTTQSTFTGAPPPTVTSYTTPPPGGGPATNQQYDPAAAYNQQQQKPSILPNLNTSGANPYLSDPLMASHYGQQNPMYMNQDQQNDFYGDLYL